MDVLRIVSLPVSWREPYSAGAYLTGTPSGPVQVQAAIFQSDETLVSTKVIWAVSRKVLPFCLKVYVEGTMT